MPSSFQGWGSSWGSSWGSVSTDPNAMAGSASFTFTPTAIATAIGELGGTAGFTFGATGALTSAGTVADVRVSWLAFDTAATEVDVKVSWVAFDTAATPCDVRVSWVCLDTASSDQTTYSAEIVLKPWYVKRKKRIYVFNSAQEADAYLAAEAEAEAAVAKAQKTSRRARKRLRDKLITVEPINTVDIDWLSELIAHFKIQADLAALLAQQDYERVLQIMAMASEMLDEEDIELLLLA